ncbi:DNA polymerase I [Candidatus Uhrbacteria bacterium]|nr:DNA polymerase I [Candidatus Uhrbacteria bacterium]
MSKPTQIFLVLDGNALLHRAWHAIPPLTTKDGLVVNAAYGFSMALEKIREQFKPDYMAVAWDLPGKTFRHEKYEAYKATREKKEQGLYDQIPIIQDILKNFRIPSLSAEGFEADDIIGTLAESAEKKNFETLIVTGDLDSLQLVKPHTKVVFFQKGISETKTYDENAVQERYGLSPEQLIDYKALRGDPSDNLPGVVGIGEKTATELLKTHKTLDGIFSALENGNIEEKIAKKLRGNEKQAKDMKELVEIVRDVKTDFNFDSAKTTEPDWNAIREIYQRLEFRTLLRKHSEDVKQEKQQNGRIQILRDETEIKKVLEKMSGRLGVFIAEQQADLFGSTQAAVSLSDGKTTIVVPNPAQKHLAEVKKIVEKSFIITHNLKHLLHQTDWSLKRTFDTMIAAYLLNSGSRSLDLSQELPKSFATQKDYERLGQFVATFPKLAEQLEQKLKSVNVFSIFEEMEIPLIFVLYEMEKAGVLLDTKALEEFAKDLLKRLSELEKKIHTLADFDFNVQSPIQLAEILFEKLKLSTKGIKKTKTGYSTAAPELEKLWDSHEIVPLISEYRELAKLQSTYVEALPKLVDKDGRVHTTYNQTVTATGRLSSSEPNLQNIPIKTELGREIRRAFVAPRGKVLIAADYSQIELRLAAVIAKDQPFIEAFKQGADIHTRTAAEVWEIDENQVTKEQRRAAKTINFGILYGMGPRSLSRSTGLSFSEAKIFIDRYFEIHHAIQAYLDETKTKAHVDGFVETIFGRRRYFPEINSGVPMLIAAAERMAINMPIQGTAADIMKKAMLAVDGWLKQSQLSATMLMQVHDELVFEVENDVSDQVARGVKEMMEGVANFEIPLIVEIEKGENWGEMEEIKVEE